MAKIAFIGMGAMGSRMALRLINAGQKVRVWNRSAERTDQLIKAGACLAETPRQASENVDFVISMLRDNEASETAWCDADKGALLGMKSGAVAIDCSTLTVAWVRELHKRCGDKGIAFLDAPVAGSRPQAEAAKLQFFVGGDRTAYVQARPILEIMGSDVHYAGLSGAGASIKLAVNSLFGVQLAVMAELISFLRLTGLDASHAVKILASTPLCSPAVKLSSAAMLAENYTPMFPIELVEKDFSYALATAEKAGLRMPITQSAWSQFKDAIEKGFGDDNITGIAQLTG